MAVWRSIVTPDQLVTIASDGAAAQRRKNNAVTGCESCRLSGYTNLYQFRSIESVTGKPIIWFSHPTETETTRRAAGTSAAARALWEHLGQYGYSRDDFDVQFAVKCTPCTRTSAGWLYHKEPVEDTYTSCMLHSSNLAKLSVQRRGEQAPVWIVFGQDTAKQVCGEHYKIDSPVFWHPLYQARVHVLAHPRPDLVAGDSDVAVMWRHTLECALWSIQNPGQYAFLHSLDVRTYTTARQLAEVIEQARASGESISLDIEDDGRGRLLVVGMCWDGQIGHVTVFDHPENPTPEETPECMALLGKFLADASLAKVMQFGSYDGVEFRNLGFTLRNYSYDTFYGSYLDQSFHRKHGLEALAQRHHPEFAGYKKIVEHYYDKGEGDEEIAGSDRGDAGLARCPLPTLCQYNGGDVILTKREEWRTRDKVAAPLMQVYIHAGMTLRRMESSGPNLDSQHCEIVARVAKDRVRQITGRLRELTGDINFNPGSPEAVAHYMYEVFELPRVGAETDDLGEEENNSTEDAVLEQLIELTGHEFPKLVQEHRKFSRYAENYAASYKSSAEHWGGQVRTKYHLAGAATGRLRSGGERRKKNQKVKHVNLQNAARHPFIKNLLCSDADWRKVWNWAAPLRKALDKGPSPLDGVEKGYPLSLSDSGAPFKEFITFQFSKWVEGFGPIPAYVLDLNIFDMWDLSAAEVRVFAFLSKDPDLIAIFNAGGDIHSMIGEKLGLGKAADIKKNKELRARVKAMVFGLLYGLKPYGLYWYMRSFGVRIEMEEVEVLHAAFFAAFPQVGVFIELQHEMWKRLEYVDTPVTFRRWMGPKYEPGRKTNWDNIAVNHPVQSTAHFFMLIVLCLISRLPVRLNRLQHPSMEVHDSLIWRTPVRYLAETHKQAQTAMEEMTVKYLRTEFGVDFNVPMVAEGGVGFRLGVELEPSSKVLGAEGGLTTVLLEWLIKDYVVGCSLAAEFGYTNA